MATTIGRQEDKRRMDGPAYGEKPRRRAWPASGSSVASTILLLVPFYQARNRGEKWQDMLLVNPTMLANPGGRGGGILRRGAPGAASNAARIILSEQKCSYLSSAHPSLPTPERRQRPHCLYCLDEQPLDRRRTDQSTIT
jgi:hypothetical protein